MAVIRQRREAAERERLANLNNADASATAVKANNWLTADNTVKPKFEEVSSSSESESSEDEDEDSDEESEEEKVIAKPVASTSSSSNAAKTAAPATTADKDAKPAKEKEKKEKGGDKLDKLPKFTSIEIKKMSGDQLKVSI